MQLDDSDPLDSFGLYKIELAHRAVFETCFASLRPQLSDYTFANTFIWRDCIHLRWQMYHDCLCVFANGDGGLSMLFPPAGEGDFQAAMRASMDLCRAFNAQLGITDRPRVEYINETAMAKLPGGCKVETMSGDYVYATRRMIDLDGGDLSSKRRCRNQFMRDSAPRVETYTPAHLSQCLDLLKLWNFQSEECSPSGAATSVQTKRVKEVTATVNALTHADALGLTGMVLYSGEKPVGFTLGEEMLDKKTVSIVIEKADRNYRGSANYIFSEFCHRHWADTEWCNAGDDWEVPSLGWTKQSYRPAFRLNKWVAWPQMEPAQVAFPVMPQAPANQVTKAATMTVSDIDRAAIGDLNDLVALESHCFGQKELFNRRQLRYLLRCPRATTYLIRRDGQIVAAAIMLRRRTGQGTSARLYSMAVDPGHRRQGFGRMLLSGCMESLEAEGASSMCLEVNAENVPAIELYKAMGFRMVKRMPNYYGPGDDALKMRLELAGETPLFAATLAAAT